MKVPLSVLNDCNDSFVAIDGKQDKASTQFFSDTGLMALLCCHNRVLWTVNVTPAGKKQYYALALFPCLFKHIPDNMFVGVLYNVGCQLHHSCLKWGFLKEFLLWITFGILGFLSFMHMGTNGHVKLYIILTNMLDLD
jgi:hypothetical protein